MFDLSAGERQFLLSADRGQGLLSTGTTRVAFQSIASDLENTLCTTSPEFLASLSDSESESGHLVLSTGDGEAAGTLAGHATGETPTAIDTTAVIRALGSGPADAEDPEPALPEPLATVVDHLGDDLIRRAFVPTAELIAALGVEPTAFGRDMSELGCTPRASRITDAEAPSDRSADTSPPTSAPPSTATAMAREPVTRPVDPSQRV